MDLSVRDWLIIIGALLAIAVLLDGFRRMRNERKDTLRLASKKRREAEEELINPELPGEARVVAVREAPSLHQRDASQKLRPQAPHDDDDVLMRDYSASETTRGPVAETPVVPDSELGRASTAEPAIEPEEAFSDEAVSAPRRVECEPAPRQSEKPAASEPQELIVLNVVADEEKPYAGADLLQVLLACDLRYGRMNIFHRFEKADGSGAEQFSVANLVEPGNFDLDAIDGFSTPGVVFFMNMPGPEDSMQAFDAMLETARCLVKNLGGELRDQTHSVATKQTLEHYRQIIRDFERRQLTLM
jgi:cell division protein ZipA